MPPSALKFKLIELNLENNFNSSGTCLTLFKLNFQYLKQQHSTVEMTPY